MPNAVENNIKTNDGNNATILQLIVAFLADPVTSYTNNNKLFFS
jgi:hypothetical protein